LSGSEFSQTRTDNQATGKRSVPGYDDRDRQASESGGTKIPADAAGNLKLEGLASHNFSVPPPPGTLATLFVAVNPVKNTSSIRRPATEKASRLRLVFYWVFWWKLFVEHLSESSSHPRAVCARIFCVAFPG
jgi:hypothetical protein